MPSIATATNIVAVTTLITAPAIVAIIAIVVAGAVANGANTAAPTTVGERERRYS